MKCLVCALVVAAACKRDRGAPPSQPDDAARARASALIAEAYGDLRPETVMRDFELVGVRYDGTLAPAAEARFVSGTREMTTAKCTTWTWHPRHGLLRGHDPCPFAMWPVPRPRCTVEEIWKRAGAAGAPVEQPARITMRFDILAESPRWTLEVEGAKPFYESYRDDCQPVVEAP